MSPTVSSEGEKNKSDNFFSSFLFRSPLGYVRKRHAYRTQLAEPDPTQVSDLKISHGKLVKKKHDAKEAQGPSCCIHVASIYSKRVRIIYIVCAYSVCRSPA